MDACQVWDGDGVDPEIPRLRARIKELHADVITIKDHAKALDEQNQVLLKIASKQIADLQEEVRQHKDTIRHLQDTTRQRLDHTGLGVGYGGYGNGNVGYLGIQGSTTV